MTAAARNLVWLASYPKSGNTWLRIFLGNYLLNPETAMPINEIGRLSVNDNVTAMYRKVGGPGFDPADHIGTLAVRPRVLAAIAGNGAGVNFLKTHSGNYVIQGAPLMPPGLTRAAVFVMRNPLDVCVSYARHFGMSPTRAAQSISRADNTTLGAGTQVKQFLGTWSDHVLSWTRETRFPVLTLRYEDLLADPEAEFGKVVTHLGFPLDTERLARAVRHSAFDEVSRQEKKTAFAERSTKSERFFHTGRSNQWRDVLSEEDTAHIREKNAEAMHQFGYL